MNEKDWTLLTALAAEKNLTRAAQRLYVTQPAVTRRIQQIERELNCAIVVRGARGVELSAEGEALARYAAEELQRLQALRELRRHYGVYMLSNTNPIMWNSFIAGQFRQEGLEINDYFDGIVTSFESKCMKPSAHIFDHAAETLKIKPSETLFLDDAEVNCRAAEALGWHAALVAPGHEFMEVLHERKLV